MRNNFERSSKDVEKLIKDAEEKIKEVGAIIDVQVEATAGKWNVSKWIIWTGGTIAVLALISIFI